MTIGFERLILSSPRYSQANVEGYRCSKCKIVLFSYEKEGSEIVGFARFHWMYPSFRSLSRASHRSRFLIQ